MWNMINMLNKMSNKMSNIYVILIIIAVIIYTFFLKEQVYESFFKGRIVINRAILHAQNEALKKNKYHCQSYINRYPDLQRAFGKSCRNRNTKIKARDHYLKYGIREGRNPKRPVPKPQNITPKQIITQVKTQPNEYISDTCKDNVKKTNRRVDVSFDKLRDARYKMEAVFRSCGRIL